MRRTIVEQIMVPELPNVLAKEQYMLYAPIANSDYPGMVKLGDMSNEDYLLTLEDGVLNVKSKVNITGVHLNTMIEDEDNFGKITFTRGDGSPTVVDGSLGPFMEGAYNANLNIIRDIILNAEEDHSDLGTVKFIKNGAAELSLPNVFAPVFNSIIKDVRIDQRVNITEENKVDDEELGPNQNAGTVTFERWGGDIVLPNLFADVFRITDVYKQGGYYETPGDVDSFRYNNSASIAGASREIAAGSMAVGPDARTFSTGAMAFGINAQSLTEGSMAVGKNAKAGSRAYYITAIQLGEVDGDGAHHGAIALSREAPTNTFENVDVISGYIIEDFDMGYEVGDEFCVINDTHYAFCGRIESIQHNIIFYETKLVRYDYNLERSTVVLPSAEFAKAQTSSTRYWRDCTLWVPSKPDIGVVVIDPSTNEEMLNTAFSFGDDSYASADDAFVSGDNVIAGGNHAVVFGVFNRGAYGNLIGMRENISTGVHSVLLGRGLLNLGKYNALFNERHEVSGQDNLVSGVRNILYGNNNLVSSYFSTVKGDYNTVFARANTVKGTDNMVAMSGNGKAVIGNYNSVFGYDNKVGMNYSLVAGRWNNVYPENLDDEFVNNRWNQVEAADVSNYYYNFVLGTKNESRRKYSVILGFENFNTNEYSTLIGRKLNSLGDTQVILGHNTQKTSMTDEDISALAGKSLIVCYNGVRLTVPKSGGPVSDTDAVTLGYFNSKLLSGKW